MTARRFGIVKDTVGSVSGDQLYARQPSGIAFVTADVTVIVSSYDRPDWLAVSLNSIQASAAFARLRGIETRILVVDDASPGDATREVAESFAGRLPAQPGE